MNIRKQKPPINISVINGRDDNIKVNEVLVCIKQTKWECKTFMLEGGIFFINVNAEDIIKIINLILEDYI